MSEPAEDATHGPDATNAPIDSPDDAPQEATDTADPDVPLSDDDIAGEDAKRARMRASYDGDGSKDLSIYDD